MTWMTALDLLLTVGLTLRLTRLIVGDDLGIWLVRRPLHDRISRSDRGWASWYGKAFGGLHCPFCVGFWIACAVVAGLWLLGGPGHVPDLARWLAAPFALNYLAGHVAKRLGDVDLD